MLLTIVSKRWPLRRREGEGSIRNMDVDEMIRERLQAALEEKGWSQAELCRKTKTVRKAALSSFLKGRTKSMGWGKYSELERALGVKLVPDGATGSDGSGGINPTIPVGWHPAQSKVCTIPLVEIARVPVGVELAERLRRIRAMAQEYVMAPVSDPNAFGIVLDAAAGQAAPGDILIVSPETPELKGNHILMDAGHRAVVAQVVEDPQRGLCASFDGTILCPYKSIGTVLGQWRPWL